MGHRKKTKRPTTVEGRKRNFVYKPLNDKPKINDTDYDPEAYDFFKSVKWDKAWKEFLEHDKDGNYKYQTSWNYAKHLVGYEGSATKKDDVRQQAEWIYAAIGPRDKKVKKLPVPYLGDWSYTRASLFIGEVSKESLLYGNPKIVAIREMLKKHNDVMEVSKGIGELMMSWVGRYDAWASQIDEHFKYKLFDPNLSDEKNEKRFASYTKKQEYIFSRTIDCTRQVLRCFGVGENDLSLLTQMMIASMRERLGDGTARMMMAAASGMKVIEGETAGSLPAATMSDQTAIDGSVSALQQNPQLALMFGTFLGKSQIYKMAHPDVEIDGVPPEDTRTDPKIDGPKMKTNGSTKHQVTKQ